MQIEGKVILVLGGAGLVGKAVCRELLEHRPRQLIVHSRRQDNAQNARQELLAEPPQTEVLARHGDIFDQTGEETTVERLRGLLGGLTEEALSSFLLYRMLQEIKPDVVIDCINTATVIAYRDVFRLANKLVDALEEEAACREELEELLEALYIPRLIRHIQVLYHGMTEVGTKAYIKVGTTGTGGMGLNIPYTHSEERPSRVLLAKNAVAGAHSMLLFLMGRTPGAPITKELKPAAAIGWKQIGYGAIERHGQPIKLVDAKPNPIGETFSTFAPESARERDEILKSVFIDTGENGLYGLEEFSALTTAGQMEFITPEEIARLLLFELQGGNTGHDVINALDSAVIGPSYRAGVMRQRALEKMIELEEAHHTHSVAFEMLGPPRISKLIFEAHLLRLAFVTMTAVRKSSADGITKALNSLVRQSPEEANRIVAVGIPILLESGELIRGPRVIVPGNANAVPVSEQRLEQWAYDGWVDLRRTNCERWLQRFLRIHKDLSQIPEEDTSSRYLRNHRFWSNERRILPGQLVGWILSEEEHGTRMK